MSNTVNQDSIAAPLLSNPALLRSAPPPATEPGAQYDFGLIFGAASDERGPITAAAADSTPSTPAPALETLTPAIAVATTTVTHAPGSATVVNTASNTTASTATSSTAADTSTAATSATSATTTTTAPASGIEALVSAIMNGTLNVSYVTDPTALSETTIVGTSEMPYVYYASDQTANQIAQLLGGTVVQKPPFGAANGFVEPLANFIELPNGMTFNAADLAYYGRAGRVGAAQLTADLTQTMNQGVAWTNYFNDGGDMPSFAPGWVGQPIPGLNTPSSMVGSDGNVINPSFQS